MNLTLIRRARRIIGRIGVGLVLVLVVFALFSQVVPLTGRQLFIIGGGSMEPAIPVGSLAIVTPTDPADISIGDVVTVRGQEAVLITHRVTRVIDDAAGWSFELKGDANPSPDAALVSAAALVGSADRFVPFAGYAQSYLSSPAGAVSVVALLLAFLCMYLLLEMLERLARESPASTPDLVGP